MECPSIRKEGSHLGHLKSSGIVDNYTAGWIVFPVLGSWIKISLRRRWWCVSVILAPGRLKEENCPDSDVSLDCGVRACLKHQ